MSTFSYGYLATWLSARPHAPHRSFRLPCSNDNLLGRIPRLLLLSLFSLVFSTSPIAYAQQGLQVDLDVLSSVPRPHQCGSITFTWSGGAPPYMFLIETGSYDTIREPFGSNWTKDTSWTWDPVAVAGGTIILAQVKDSTNQKTSTPEFMVQNSTDGSCLGMTLASPWSTTAWTTSGHSAYTAPSVSISSLSTANTSAPSIPSSSSSQTSSRQLSTGTIAHISVGLAGIILLSAGALFYLRRRRRAAPGAAVGLFDWLKKCFGSSEPNCVDRRVADGDATRVWPFIDTVRRDGLRRVDMSEVQAQTNSSLEAQASSMDSPARDHAARFSDTHRQRKGIGGPRQSQKLSRELRTRAVHTFVAGAGCEQGDVLTQDPVSSGHEIEHRRGPCHETDGGVRLAGGRAGEDLVNGFDRRSTSDGSTLPPPYSSHFGGT